MLLKNDGFFLLELLLSLSVWIMIGVFFVPLLIDLKNQSQELEITNKANQLLYEELHAKLSVDLLDSGYSVFDSRREYRIDWRDAGELKEVCVSVVEGSSQPKTEICAFQE
jgi:competence protein ComGE